MEDVARTSAFSSSFPKFREKKIMSQSMFCEQCGAALVLGVRFCEACGQPVVELAAAVPPVMPLAAPPLVPSAGASSAAPPSEGPMGPSSPSHRLDRRLIIALIGIAALLMIAVVTVLAVRLARERAVAEANVPCAVPALTIAPTDVGPEPPTALPEASGGTTVEPTYTASPQPTVFLPQSAAVLRSRRHPRPPQPHPRPR